MEIMAPRGIIPQDTAITPSVVIRNNSTASGTVSVHFTVEDYTDMNSIYLESGSSGELAFTDWIPAQLGACSTICSIATMDQRSMNDVIIGEVFVSDETGIEEGSGLFPVAMLQSPVPNPFAATTTISFQLAESGDVRLDVYDLSGRLMANLVEDTMVAGSHSVPLDATGMTSGVYFIRLVAPSSCITTRALLIR